MGRNIYFTDRELNMVRDYVFEAMLLIQQNK